MDFDFAAQRLRRDQATIRPSSSRRNRVVSERAKRQADAMKRRQAELMKEKQLRQKQEAYRLAYMNKCERALGLRSLKMSSSDDNNFGGGGLELRATSIYGDGDKIALPPSVLGFLTEQQMSSSSSSSSSSSPWIFRVGIRNPEYIYPASALVRDMQPPSNENGDDSQQMDYDDDYDDDDIDTNNEDDDAKQRMDAYLDELSYKYLSYTHATVVEFTQEEGYVGLPELISKALLNPSSSSSSSKGQQQKIPVTRTVDPASAASGGVDAALQQQQKVSTETAETNAPMNVDNNDDDDDDKTPGHLAWGAFDIPDTLIEIALVKLPKGKACKLRPTKQAIQSGFYNLKDIKLVLEQSLIRTRATLSIHDNIYTWHRGIKYDVQVTSVTPSMYDAIVCINTDIEVDFDAPEEEQVTTTQQQHDKHASANNNNSNVPTGSFSGGGRTLASSSSSSTTSTPVQQQQSTSAAAAATTTAITPLKELLPEPPIEQKEHVCTVQLRGGNASGNGGNGRRRFDVTQATVGDLFAFAYHALSGSGGQQDAATSSSSSSFSLVTRFPRRVLTTDMSTSTLQDAGISQGQELFMIERA